MAEIPIAELKKIERRAGRASGEHWTLSSAGGVPIVEVTESGQAAYTMTITREDEPASQVDVAFIASARADVEALLAHLRGPRSLSRSELGSIASRCEASSPPPWTTFLESDQGSTGCNVIRVGEDDDQPDLYLWVVDQLASDEDFEFVAAARQDIPRLLEASVGDDL